MPAKTFFSYSRSDKEFTRKLATDLRNAGADLWIDQLDIQPGTRWDDEIETALKSAESILVILSPNAVASNNIMDEISYALENNKKVIPVIFKQCEVPFRLKRLQYIDFVESYEEGFERLCAVLNLNRQSAPPVIPVIPEVKQNTDYSIHETNDIKPAAPFQKKTNPPSTIVTTEKEEPTDNIQPQNKKRKWLYIGAGAVVVLIILFFLFNKKPDNQQSAMQDATADSSNAEPQQDATADSVKAQSLFDLADSAYHNKDYAGAVDLFQQSAALGNPESMYNLGYLYEGYDSTGLADFDKMLYWFRKGAASYCLDAMYSYGMVLNGNNLSDYFKIPDEYVNRDSAMYYWQYVNDRTPGGVIGYKKTSP